RRGEYGGARLHGLQHGYPEPLVQRRVAEHLGVPVEARQVLVRYVDERPNEIAVGGRRRKCGLRLPAGRTRERERPASSHVGVESLEGRDQTRQVLAWLHRGRDEHVWASQTVTAQYRLIVLARLGREAPVG